MLFDNLFRIVGPAASAGILFALLALVFSLFSVGRHFRHLPPASGAR